MFTSSFLAKFLRLQCPLLSRLIHIHQSLLSRCSSRKLNRPIYFACMKCRKKAFIRLFSWLSQIQAVPSTNTASYPSASTGFSLTTLHLMFQAPSEAISGLSQQAALDISRKRRLYFLHPTFEAWNYGPNLTSIELSLSLSDL
ncbi:hypothetical protein BYT27DRAFT_6949219 [Phlegmacium glaucopus]|nr:hypothetical protein BYT27DRAFT_6949219 [Phlegmacium glaucopus]